MLRLRGILTFFALIFLSSHVHADEDEDARKVRLQSIVTDKAHLAHIESFFVRLKVRSPDSPKIPVIQNQIEYLRSKITANEKSEAIYNRMTAERKGARKKRILFLVFEKGKFRWRADDVVGTARNGHTKTTGGWTADPSSLFYFQEVDSPLVGRQVLIHLPDEPLKLDFVQRVYENGAIETDEYYNVQEENYSPQVPRSKLQGRWISYGYKKRIHMAPIDLEFENGTVTTGAHIVPDSGYSLDVPGGQRVGRWALLHGHGDGYAGRVLREFTDGSVDTDEFMAPYSEYSMEIPSEKAGKRVAFLEKGRKKMFDKIEAVFPGNKVLLESDKTVLSKNWHIERPEFVGRRIKVVRGKVEHIETITAQFGDKFLVITEAGMAQDGRWSTELQKPPIVDPRIWLRANQAWVEPEAFFDDGTVILKGSSGSFAMDDFNWIDHRVASRNQVLVQEEGALVVKFVDYALNDGSIVIMGSGEKVQRGHYSLAIQSPLQGKEIILPSSTFFRRATDEVAFVFDNGMLATKSSGILRYERSLVRPSALRRCLWFLGDGFNLGR